MCSTLFVFFLFLPSFLSMFLACLHQCFFLEISAVVSLSYVLGGENLCINHCYYLYWLHDNRQLNSFCYLVEPIAFSSILTMCGYTTKRVRVGISSWRFDISIALLYLIEHLCFLLSLFQPLPKRNQNG